MDSDVKALLDALCAAYPNCSASYENLSSKDDHRFDFRDKKGSPSRILMVGFVALAESDAGKIVEYLKRPQTEKAWKAKGVNDALVLYYDAADGLKQS